MSLGKNEGSSAGGSVWGAQAPFLHDLYSRAHMYSYQPGGQDPYASQVADGALSGYGNQMGGGFQNQQMLSNLQGLGSGSYQNQHLGGAIQAGLGDINRNFQRNILPGINTGAAMTNTSGGSRQGIAQGLAAGEANRQASDFVNQMYSQNFGQTLQSMLGANQQLGGLQQQQNLAQQGALSQAPNIAALGMAPTQNYWQNMFAPLQAYGNILGPPVNLGGGSTSSGWSVGIGPPKKEGN